MASTVQVQKCRAEYVQSDGLYTWPEWVQRWFGCDVWRARDIIRAQGVKR